MLPSPPPADAAHITQPTPIAATPFRLSTHAQLNTYSHSTAPSTVPKPTTEGGDGNSSGMSIGLVAGIAGGCAAAILTLVLLFLFWRKKKKKKIRESDFGEKDAHTTDVQQPPEVVTFQSKHSSTSSSVTPLSPTISFQKTRSFTYEELERATDGFSLANLLGEGGFGYVHKGVLPDGKEVAIKQLKAGSVQGEREFQAEVDIISRVQHKHLVSLVGYCLMEHWRMLVYEFVPNNNLEFHLHGNRGLLMDWVTRLKVALGAAKGIAYLHEDCDMKIIHRDIKASNILLDLDFEAKVADFGLAKLFSDAQTHVSTRVMGTFGYLAPEYAYSGKLTEKSDVFSFGVLLLELITGRPPVQRNKALKSEPLVNWVSSRLAARPLFTQALDGGDLDCLVDPAILTDTNRKEIARMVASAAACVFDTAKLRPKMSQVVMALQGDASLLFKMSREMSHINSRGYNSYVKSPEYDTAQYSQDMKKFRQLALGSTICESSDRYSNSTGKGESGCGGQLSTEMEAGKAKMDC